MDAVGKKTCRMNVTFPSRTAEELARFVPPGQRNRFIVEATEKALRRERLIAALEASAGAWSDEDHPDLQTQEDIDRWVRGMRDSWRARTWSEMAEGD